MLIDIEAVSCCSCIGCLSPPLDMIHKNIPATGALGLGHHVNNNKHAVEVVEWPLCGQAQKLVCRVK